MRRPPALGRQGGQVEGGLPYSCRHRSVVDRLVLSEEGVGSIPTGGTERLYGWRLVGREPPPGTETICLAEQSGWGKVVPPRVRGPWVSIPTAEDSVREAESSGFESRDTHNGCLAEWIGSGLQSPLPPFDPGSSLYAPVAQ